MLSVVVPMYNEEAVVPLFVARLRPVLDDLVRLHDDLTYEVVCVDDYPSDVAERYRASWHPLATLTDPAVVADDVWTLPSPSHVTA